MNLQLTKTVFLKHMLTFTFLTKIKRYMINGYKNILEISFYYS